MSDTIFTRFICKICGISLEDQSTLNQHIENLHHPKRTVTINDIINNVVEGKINFPNTKAEIVKEVEEEKSNKPDVITSEDILSINGIKLEAHGHSVITREMRQLLHY